MRLECATYVVRRVEFAERTVFSKGLLTINKGELAALVGADDAVESIDIELARPGESTRIIHVLDAIEPLVKVAGNSICYPGILGAATTCGDGRTNRLKGVAVLECGEFPHAVSGVLSFYEGFVDMSGPAAPLCTCSDTFNVVVILKPIGGITNEEWDEVVRRAGMKAADYLARTTLDREADSVEIFELGNADPALPRAIYIDQIQEQGMLVHTLAYGKHLDNLVPTLIHPNEMLDGAIVSANYKGGLRIATIVHTNNPVLTEMYRRHGRDLNFVGVVLSRGHHDDHQQKERSAQYAAKLAKMMQADCAIITLEGTGNAHVDHMLTVKACEDLGIKTVALLHEFGGPDGTDTPLVDSVPEADAIVTVGGADRTVKMPMVERVIGGSAAFLRSGVSVDPYGPFETVPLNLYCGSWQLGMAGCTAKEF